MPINIRDPELEARIDRAAKSNGVRTSKHSLVASITNAVLVAAEARGQTVGRVVDELMSTPTSKPRKQAV